MKSAVNRQTVDLSGYPDLVVIYLGMRATVMASSLAATLERVREGQVELHQQGAFAPIYLRKRSEAKDLGAGRSPCGDGLVG